MNNGPVWQNKRGRAIALARQPSVSRKRTRRSAHIIFGGALLWPLMESWAKGDAGRGGRGGGERLEEEYRRVFPLTRQRDGRRPLERRRARSHRAWWRAGERSVPQDTGAHTRIRLSRRTRARARASIYLSLSGSPSAFYRGHYAGVNGVRVRGRDSNRRAPRSTVDTWSLCSSCQWEKRGPPRCALGRDGNRRLSTMPGRRDTSARLRLFFSSRASGCHSHG